MPALLRAGSRLNPIRDVPSGLLRVDWTHPLTRGLIACYVPGIMRGINIAQPGNADLALQSAAKLTSTKEGPSLLSNANNTGGQVLAPSTFKTSVTRRTIYYRGVQTTNGDAVNGGAWFEAPSWDNAATTPFEVSAMGASTNDPVGGVVSFQYNINGTFSSINGGTTIAKGDLLSIGGTLNSTSTVANLFENGFISATVSNYTAVATSAATATVSIGTTSVSGGVGFTGTDTIIACIWNVEFGEARMTEMHLNPFCFLVPATEYEMSALSITDILRAQIWM